MKFSDIIVKPVLSPFFQEVGYVLHREGKTECVIIDPGLQYDVFFRLLDKDDLIPLAVLITHGHGDHIAGISALKAVFPTLKVYIGELDSEKLTDPVQNLSATFGVSLILPEADVLLQEGNKLELAGISFEVRHVPGHSKGHVVYSIPSEPKGMVFVGDVIFQGGIGRNDFPDGDPEVQIPMIRSKILTLPDETVIYPGHGNPTTVGEERRSNPYL